ncbi:MAG: biotin--[acetyl-CoA-carboxylase] ligase [Desulfobacterales bacterium]|nr:biotin--[acetyl-CoA-carboxylase] ligase [Desulfobacterales bacterium]
MKKQILEILRQKQGIVSGEVLSARLGISRVSIWKHIKKLQELGYEFESTSRGYRLGKEPDSPFPWELPNFEDRVHYLEEAVSTMDTARELARSGCPDFTVVIAGRQTGGRGRLKRFWDSQAGGLYFTLVIRPEIPPTWSYRYTFAAALVLARTIRKTLDIAVDVKWPNDLLVNEKKVSGMLSEMEAEADRVAFISIGLGLNVNNEIAPDVPNAASLRQVGGRSISRKELLGAFLDNYREHISTGTLAAVVADWKKYTVTLNRAVTIETPGETIRGTALDVDDTGGLIVRLESGEVKTVVYGDCFHR